MQRLRRQLFRRVRLGLRGGLQRLYRVQWLLWLRVRLRRRVQGRMFGFMQLHMLHHLYRKLPGAVLWRRGGVNLNLSYERTVQNEEDHH